MEIIGVYLLILIIGIIDKVFFVGPNSRYRKLKIASVIILLIGLGIGVYYGFKILNNSKPIGNDGVSVSSGFDINSYEVELDVQKNNKIDVTERIETYFKTTGKHGIYRFIPYWSEYTSSDKKIMSRRADISDIKAIGEKYTLDTVKGKKRIKIGSASKTLPIGTHNYLIQYNYDFGKDPYKGFDELIFHCYGDYWGTSINNPSVKIRLPQEVDLNNKINLYTDKYREKNVNDNFIIKYDKNIININPKPGVSLTNALTVSIKLPENYFSSSVSGIFGMSFLICLFCIFVAIFAVKSWFKVGKDFKDIETVEFYPPYQFDAAQVGYINSSLVGGKLIGALIVGLAAKGYISIEKKGYNHYILKRENKNFALDPITTNEQMVLDQLFYGDNFLETELPLSTTTTIIKDVEDNLVKTLDDQLYNKKSYNLMLVFSILFAVCNLALGIAYTSIKDMDASFNFLYLIALISNAVTFIFAGLLKSNTQFSASIKAKIKGFKRYLELAEKEQIEAQAQDNPYLFYDILPYAYVLGITKIWIDKFKVIPLPKYDTGNFDFTNVESINDISNDISRNSYTSTSSSSSSSGCSSCGGGCSSCGGGCSSCGGGGSW